MRIFCIIKYKAYNLGDSCCTLKTKKENNVKMITHTTNFLHVPQVPVFYKKLA